MLYVEATKAVASEIIDDKWKVQSDDCAEMIALERDVIESAVNNACVAYRKITDEYDKEDIDNAAKDQESDIEKRWKATRVYNIILDAREAAASYEVTRLTGAIEGYKARSRELENDYTKLAESTEELNTNHINLWSRYHRTIAENNARSKKNNSNCKKTSSKNEQQIVSKSRYVSYFGALLAGVGIGGFITNSGAILTHISAWFPYLAIVRGLFL